MQQGKDRLTSRLAAYSNMHQLKHTDRNPTWTTDFMDHQSDVSRLWEHVAFHAAKPRQSSKSPLTWRVLPNDIMQTLQVLVLPPTFFKASLWEPWQQSAGHPIETRWTLCLLSEPQTQNVTLTLSLVMCGLYRKKGGMILNMLDWLLWNSDKMLCLQAFQHSDLHIWQGL